MDSFSAFCLASWLDVYNQAAQYTKFLKTSWWQNIQAHFGQPTVKNDPTFKQ